MALQDDRVNVRMLMAQYTDSCSDDRYEAYPLTDPNAYMGRGGGGQGILKLCPKGNFSLEFSRHARIVEFYRITDNR